MSNKNQRKKSDKDKTQSVTSGRKGRTEILEQEINKAIQAVTRTKARTNELHSHWRAQLLRMSYLVALLSMHQCSTPIGECIKELKMVTNNERESNDDIHPITALCIILGNCMVELFNFIIAVALYKFLSLRNPHGTFSNLSYCLSSSLIIGCLGMFFYHHHKLSTKNEEDYDYNGGCFASLASWTGDIRYVALSKSNFIERSKRQFPVSCIFHVIVTGCYFFMKLNMDQCDANVVAMEKLQKDLLEKENTSTNAKGGEKSKKKSD